MRVLLLASSLLLTGCGLLGPKVYQTPEEITADVTVNVDDFKGTRSFITPEFNGGGAIYQIRYLDRGPGTQGFTQVYVNYWASSWAFLESAYASGNRRLDFVQIDRHVGYGGYIRETVGITLNDALIEEMLAADGGFQMKLYGQKRNVIVTVAPIVVRALLDALPDQAAAPAR